MGRTIRYIELFAGIGGFRYGIEQASASPDQRQLLSGATDFTCVYANEFDKYDLQWQVLNSKDFGVPQNRERVFIVGHRRGTPRPQVFPFTQTTAASLVHMGGVMSAASAFDNLEKTKFYQLDRIYHIRGIARTLMATGRGTGKTSGLYYFPPVQNAEKAYRAGHIRRLIPLECERLQVFPDGWTKLGVHGEAISNAQRYKMLGNAVTTKVVTAIIRRLISGKERHA